MTPHGEARRVLLGRLDRYWYEGRMDYPEGTLDRLRDALVAGGATEAQAGEAVYRMVVAPRLLEDAEAMDAMVTLVLADLLAEARGEKGAEA